MASAKRGLSRREFVQTTGGLIIGFCLADGTIVPRLLAQVPQNATGNPPANVLDSWLHIDQSGIVRIFTGKVEIGMGVETGMMQVVSEELDVAMDRVVFVMGDTSRTPDQGGVGGSTTMALGVNPIRNVTAVARSLLMNLASRRLGVPVDQLEAADGIVRVQGHPAKHVSYGELTKNVDLQDPLVVTGAGFGLSVKGTAKPKDPATYKIVGKSIPRVDLRPKILGKWQYATDIRIPGMLHGRVIRPAGVGAKFVSVDERSAKEISGYIKTVVNGDFVGVLAENEWAAVKAAKAVKVTWTAPAQAFPEQAELYDYMREATPKSSREILKNGDFDAAMAGAKQKVQASYKFPFTAHATMGPGCCVADVHMDGITTIWCGTQKPHGLQVGIADLLKVSPDKMRIIWTEDSGSYGRAGYEDSAADAALLSQAIGKPVRVQWMRADMTSWGAKGPPVCVDMAAGLDEDGKVIAFQFTSYAFSGSEVNFLPTTAGNFLAGQLAGNKNTFDRPEYATWTREAVAYPFPNVIANGHVLPPLFETASPLRTTHLRDPEGPATTFATESFIDELAVAATTDSIEFRMRHLEDVRLKAAMRAAAEKFSWDSRPSPDKSMASAEIVKGRGIALGDRGGTRVATIAEVEVDRRTGVVRIKRLVCAHDCGLIVNPAALRGTIEGNLIQSMSRCLFEEVKFDCSNVTSVDWISYPIAMSTDLPDKVEVILIDHPDLPSSGAGEPSSRPTAAAINNAIFDATGVRIRQSPFTAEKIKTALAADARA